MKRDELAFQTQRLAKSCSANGGCSGQFKNCAYKVSSADDSVVDLKSPYVHRWRWIFSKMQLHIKQEKAATI